MDTDTPNEVLMDFSNMFKAKKMPPRPALKSQAKETPTEEEATVVNVVPTSVVVTQEEMRLRRCLDVRRWYCLSRPQY